MQYQYIGSAEDLFDRRGLSNTDDCPYNSIEDFASQDVTPMTKDEFDNLVALPFKLGGLSDSEYTQFFYEQKHDVVILQDTTDNDAHLFVKNLTQPVS